MFLSGRYNITKSVPVIRFVIDLPFFPDDNNGQNTASSLVDLGRTDLIMCE